MSIQFDRTGFRVDGEDAYLNSGEFHYFRVPRGDWKRRMELFKSAGGNTLATYVPWLIHEPEEGDIRFGDIPNRDLAGFLETAKETGLNVILRPGPYQYSELRNDGLPEWLLRDYPQVLARSREGKPIQRSSISYLHPLVLEKARKYYRAFASVARAYMAENGGPVAMIQLDNEVMGIHLWFGSMDYNPETMGFGREDGRYAVWLRKKYGRIEALNGAYDSAYASFAEVTPFPAGKGAEAEGRRARDYGMFYRAAIAEYFGILRSWLRQDGLNVPLCHNSGNPNMDPLFPEIAEEMGEGFLLGSDHYYTLDQFWAQNSPTPQYALRVLESCDELRAMGMPPSVLELPGGSPSDTPPILREDLLACYMTNAALGAKGVNYYIYTGGPNMPGTGNTCDLYDYNALVRADGSRNETFEAFSKFSEFQKTHRFLQRARRAASVQVAFDWNAMRAGDFEPGAQTMTGEETGKFLERGVLYTLMCSRCSPELVPLDREPDRSRPLIVPCPSALSDKAQRILLDYLNAGGKVLILPCFPETDEEYRPDTRLRDAVGGKYRVLEEPPMVVEVLGKDRVFRAGGRVACEELPGDAAVIASDPESGAVLGFEKTVGKGKLIWLGCDWKMTTFDQPVMLEHLLERLGAVPCVESSNRNLFTALWEDDAGRRTLFVLNLYSGAQKTSVRVWAGDTVWAKDLALAPMEVKVLDL